MKKFVLLWLSCTALFLQAAAAGFEFAPDFADPASLTAAQMKFINQNKCAFVKNASTLDRPMLVVKRGAVMPQAQLTQSLGAGENFSYSCDLVRLEKNSSMCLGLENAKHEMAGAVFINDRGEVLLLGSDMRYVKSDMALETGKIYHISVLCSRTDNSAQLNIDGLGEFKTGAFFPADLNNFRFAPQPPMGNSCLVGNFKFSVFEKAAKASAKVKFFAPDLADRNTWSNSFAEFSAQDKLKLEKSARTGNQTMLVNRRGAVSPTIKLADIIADDEDFGYSFVMIRPADESSMCIGVSNSKTEFGGLIYVNTAGDLLLFGNQNRYENTGMNLQAGKKYRISVRCFRDAGSAEVEVKGVGKYTAKVNFPANLNRLQFIPQKPEGNQTFVSDIDIHVAPARIFTRENALKNVSAKLVNGSTDLSGLTDGNTSERIFVPEKAVIEFDLPQRITATAIQLFSGELEHRNNPSGACGIASYRLEGLYNGAWMVLVDAEDVGDKAQSGVFTYTDLFDRHDFEPVVLDGLRLVLEKSYDTGKRFTGSVSDDQRGVNLREIEVFSDKTVAMRLDLRDWISCDWELPVYRNSQSADFITFVAKHPDAPESAELIVKNPDNSVLIQKKLTLEPGKNSCTLDIAAIPDGRYVTELVIGDQSLKTLLRVEHVEAIQAPAEPMQMAGKKMFFTPDNYSLAEYENLEVEISDVKTKQLVQTPSEDKLLLFGKDFYQSTDGRYIMKVTDRTFKNQMFGSDSTRIMASNSLDEPFVQIAEAPPAQSRPQIFSPNNGFGRPPANTVFELYDETKHKVPLNNLSYVYNYFPTDYGCLKATRRSIYVVGLTTDNKWVMMRREPLFIDKTLYGDNDLDNGFFSNDNFGGMWLSPDGKECYWAQGQTLKRNRAFVPAYDNFTTGIRMMGVYSTSDGVNWRYRYCVSVPDRNDPKGYQHYGMTRYHVKNSDLYLVYLLGYDCLRQQIVIELNYSRNGVSFHRFPGNKLFVSTRKPGEWFFGHMFFGQIVLHRDGKYYQHGIYSTPLPHFAPEVLGSKSKLSEVTAEDFRKRFESRDLETEWPYFKEIGGYEGLAELVRNGYYAAGLFEFREDGWFSLKAGSTPGSFRSRTFTGVSKIYANADAADGRIEIELIDKATNEVIEKKIISEDNVKVELFSTDSSREYFLRGTLQNARLYTLCFE